MAYLWNSRATGIWSKYFHQRNCKKGKTQSPKDVHYVVHDIRSRALKSKNSLEYEHEFYSVPLTQVPATLETYIKFITTVISIFGFGIQIFTQAQSSRFKKCSCFSFLSSWEYDHMPLHTQLGKSSKSLLVFISTMIKALYEQSV